VIEPKALRIPIETHEAKAIEAETPSTKEKKV